MDVKLKFMTLNSQNPIFFQFSNIFFTNFESFRIKQNFFKLTETLAKILQSKF